MPDSPAGKSYTPTRLWPGREQPPASLRPLLRQIDSELSALVFNRGSALDTLSASGQSPDAFCLMVGAHGVGPLLGERVERGVLIVDARVSGWLLNQLAINRQRHQRMRATLDDVVNHAQRRGIEVVPLKGAAFLAQDVGAVTWRVIGDLDLLTPSTNDRELDLAVAYAGYCLDAVSWKHREYAPCSQPAWDRELVGESLDYPIKLELHPRVDEYFRGFRLDLTTAIRADQVVADRLTTPGPIAMALHLAAHASVAMLEGSGRLIQIVDLDRALERTTASRVIALVGRANLPRNARFLYPSVALVARHTDSAVAQELEATLSPHVPMALRRWVESVSAYDLTYYGRADRVALDRTALWAKTRADRARMVAATLAPSPAILASEHFDGEGIVSVASWYPRYYRTLFGRIASRRRR